MALWNRGRKSKTSLNQLTPPEGVPIRLIVAGFGVRLGAQIVDVIFTTITAICIVLFLVFLGFSSPATMVAVVSLCFFMTRVPYYIISELIWNGQTLGKRFLKIKVVAHDGGSLTVHALVTRNILKEAEVFLPGTLILSLNASQPIYSGIALLWVTVAIAIPLLNKYRRRLGDFLAGTHVVHLPEHLLLKDLAIEGQIIANQEQEFRFQSNQLDYYGVFELQTLETFLRQNENVNSHSAFERRAVAASAIVERIRKKIGYADPIRPQNQFRFLRAFYSAQRQHLEQRQILGDRRSDKFHSEKS